jgi:hypothetical protein
MPILPKQKVRIQYVVDVTENGTEGESSACYQGTHQHRFSPQEPQDVAVGILPPPVWFGLEASVWSPDAVLGAG